MICNLDRCTIAVPDLIIKGRRLLLTLALLNVVFITSAVAQEGGGHMLYGDFKVDESKATGTKPLSFDIILYASGGGRLVSRQTVVNNSRYRFLDVSNGDYDIVVEVENTEVARLHFLLNEPFRTDIRKDIELEWRENLIGKGSKKVVTTADIYKRTATNEKRFVKAENAMDKKNYPQAIVFFREILNEDVKDYQSWSELGTGLPHAKRFRRI